jgi:hypothetical protein
MSNFTQPIPANFPKMIWFGMLMGVALFVLIIYVAGDKLAAERVSTGTLDFVLGSGFLLALPYPAMRLLQRRASDQRWQMSVTPEQGGGEQEQLQKEIQRLLIRVVVAEFPATLGIAYAFLGGERSWAYILCGISLLFILWSRPEKMRNI